jgi:hypothetical protein
MRFRKAQVWSYDLIIGSILFLIAIGILTFFWWSVTTSISRNEEKIIQESLKFSDALLTPGFPQDWSIIPLPDFQWMWSSVKQVGLTVNNTKRTLDWIKTGCFYSMSSINYTLAKLTARSHYDYYITLNRYNGTEYAIPINFMWYINSSTGLDPLISNAKSIVKTERIVIYQNETVRFKLLTWTDQVWD